MGYVSALIAQDVASHTPTIIIDSFGELKTSIENTIHTNDASSVEHIKVARSLGQFSPHLFQDSEKNSETIIKNVTDFFSDIFDPKKAGFYGPRFQSVIRYATAVLLTDSNPTMFKLCKLLTDSAYLQSLLPHVKDESVRAYWLRQTESKDDFFKSEMRDYLTSRFSALVSSGVFAESGNSEGIFDLMSALRQKKTIIFDMSEIIYEEELFTIASALILRIIENAMLVKSDVGEFSFYIDEIQMHNISRIKKFAIFARRYGVALTYITSRTTEVNFMQDFRQPSTLYECAKFGTKISFRQTGSDRDFVEKMFVQTQDHETVPTLAKLKKGDMWIQKTDDGEIQSPVFIKSSEM